MEREAFDRLARAFGHAGSRRTALGLAFGGVAAVLRGERVGAAAFDRNCRRFILSAGSNPEDKFRHVDDDLLVELQRKGRRGWKTIFEDDNGTPNNEKGRIKPVKFRARVGDKLRITVHNSEGTGSPDDSCEFDGAWLFCDERGSRGKQVVRRYQRTRVGSGNCRANANFIEETFRIKP